jgi:hypothetical protein
MKTDTQTLRAASAKVKNYVAKANKESGQCMQYYYIRGFFHINNIDSFNTAKSICEKATGLKFKHFTNSMCKLDFSQF